MLWCSWSSWQALRSSSGEEHERQEHFRAKSASAPPARRPRITLLPRENLRTGATRDARYFASTMDSMTLEACVVRQPLHQRQRLT